MFDKVCHINVYVPVTGKQKCFVCKVVDFEVTVVCSEKSCGQRYHVNCVRYLLPDHELSKEKTFVCPLHLCATCLALGKTVFAGVYSLCLDLMLLIASCKMCCP